MDHIARITVPIEGCELAEFAAAMDACSGRAAEMPLHLRRAIIRLATAPREEKFIVVETGRGLVLELTPAARIVLAELRARGFA